MYNTSLFFPLGKKWLEKSRSCTVISCVFWVMGKMLLFKLIPVEDDALWVHWTLASVVPP